MSANISKSLFENHRAVRLKEHDYCHNGCYFVTTCVKHSKTVFGWIFDGTMYYSAFGQIVRECLIKLPFQYPNCVVHSYVIMPNHVHMLIQINNEKNNHNNHEDQHPGDLSKKSEYTTLKEEDCRHPKSEKIHGLCEMIRGFKSLSSRRINKISTDRFEWQKSFYDHIIYNQTDYNKITSYILNNPKSWQRDHFYQG